MRGKSLVSLILGFVLSTSVVLAQGSGLPPAGATPGIPFFFLERFFEGIGTLLTFGGDAKAERLLNLAEERLAEAEALARQQDPDASRAIGLYEEQLNGAIERGVSADVVARVTEATSKHITVLEGVLAQVPEQAKSAIQRALEVSKQGQVAALQALAGKNPAEAVYQAVAAMRERAAKAREAAVRGDDDETEGAVADVERLRGAVDSSARQNRAAATRYGEGMLEVLGDLDEIDEAADDKLPADVKARITQAKSRSVDSHTAALKTLVREDPAKAAEIFRQAGEARLRAAEKEGEDGDGEGAVDDLEDFQKYAAFGEEIATLAGGSRTGETTVEDLVKRATSYHLTVLEDVRKKLPAAALAEFERAMSAAKKVQEARPTIQPSPAQPSTPPPGAPPTPQGQP